MIPVFRRKLKRRKRAVKSFPRPPGKLRVAISTLRRPPGEYRTTISKFPRPPGKCRMTISMFRRPPGKSESTSKRLDSPCGNRADLRTLWEAPLKISRPPAAAWGSHPGKTHPVPAALGTPWKSALSPTPPLPEQSSGAEAGQTLVDTPGSLKYNRKMLTVIGGASAA